MIDLKALHQQMTQWRRDLHQNPEFGFEEQRTAAFVAATLRDFGIDVTEGVGGTGVVGTLRRGASHRTIALRADMDALRITEANDSAWASATAGTMHACGHDGHNGHVTGCGAHASRERWFRRCRAFHFPACRGMGAGRAGDARRRPAGTFSFR